MTQIDPLRLIEPRAYGEHGHPHNEWAWLRREAPVKRFDAPGWPPFWAITRHADIVEISKQPEVFLNAPGMTLTREDRMAEEGAAPQIRTVINMDPPDHRKFRHVASPCFTPRAMKKLQPLLEQTARELIDNPAQIDHWARNPQGTPKAIDEIVRVVTPVNIMVRTAAKDSMLRGQAIRAGELKRPRLDAWQREPSVRA
jgi:cytochrome P450